MLLFPVSHNLPPAPRILHQGSTATQGASQPFAPSYTPHADSDCVAWTVGYGRNQDRTFGTATFATFTMVAVKSEDNGGTDRAGFALFYITKASYIAQGGSAANWATSQAFSISCPEGNPDSWHGTPYSLAGVNQTTPVPAGLTATSQSSGVAAKSVALDTRALGKNVLVLGGRTIARIDTVTFTPGTGVAELVDTGATSESFFNGKADDLPPQNFAFACTASSAAFDGDAMAAAAFQG